MHRELWQEQGATAYHHDAATVVMPVSTECFVIGAVAAFFEMDCLQAKQVTSVPMMLVSLMSM